MKKEKPEKGKSPYCQMTTIQKYALYLSNSERVFRSSQIRYRGFGEEFNLFFENVVNDTKPEERLKKIETVLLELRDELRKQKGWVGRFISYLRKPKASKWRLGIGLALMVPGALVGLGLIGAGAVPAAGALAVAGAVLAAVGKFAFLDAAYDKIHQKVSGRKNGRYSVAAQVFYRGKDEKIKDRLAEVYDSVGGEDIAKQLHEELGIYAKRMRRHRIAKYSAALAFALLPINPIKMLFEGVQQLLPQIGNALDAAGERAGDAIGKAGHWVGGIFSSHGPVADTLQSAKQALLDTVSHARDSIGFSSQDLSPALDTGNGGRVFSGLDATAVQPDAGTAVLPAPSIETFVVPDGGGYWDVAKGMAKGLSGFDALSPERQNLVISAIKNTLIDKSAEHGIGAGEWYAQAGAEPGLFRGATATLDSAQKGAFQRLSDLMSVDSGRIPADMQQNRFTVAKLTSLLENRTGSSWKEAFSLGGQKPEVRAAARAFQPRAVPVAP